MKTVAICVAILLSFLLLANFCYAVEQNVAEFQPAQGTDIANNGEEAQEEKLKLLPHHLPFHKKKPFFKPAPKKPIPHHPILKKPLPKPHYPPVFPSHP